MIVSQYQTDVVISTSSPVFTSPTAEFGGTKMKVASSRRYALTRVPHHSLMPKPLDSSGNQRINRFSPSKQNKKR